jgi:hypothetical protein
MIVAHTLIVVAPDGFQNLPHCELWAPSPAGSSVRDSYDEVTTTTTTLMAPEGETVRAGQSTAIEKGPKLDLSSSSSS